MNIKIRAFLFSITLCFVAVAGPALVLYAQGYRYNFAKQKIEQTGVLFIKSYPRSANITINDQMISKRTPTEVPNLLPSNYRVVVSKDGYISWQKEVIVKPKRTTFLEDVTLFKGEPNTNLILGATIKQGVCSDINRKLAVFSTNTLSIIDTNRNKVVNQKEFPVETEISGWSKNGVNILLKDSKGFYIYSPESKVIKSVALNKKSLQKVVWENNSDTIVYGKINNQLYKYDFSKDRAEIYDPTNNWQTIQPMGSTQIGIKQDKNNMLLSVMKGKAFFDLMTVPKDDNYEINILSDKYLLLLNKALNVAYIINPSDTTNPLETYVSNIKNFSWLNDTLLYWNDHEINIYHVPSRTKQTIERTSEQINNVNWHNGLVNIFAIINNQLKIYELDNRDKRNVFDYQNLGTLDNKSAIICFSKNGDELFANYSSKERTGIYHLIIQ